MSTGELEQVLAAVGASGARHLVVGGVATVLHGHPRLTADLDLVVKLDRTNALLLIEALEALGYRPRAPVPARQYADPAHRTAWVRDKGLTVFSLWSPRFPATEVDLFVEEPFDFDAVDARAVEVEIGGAVVRVISIRDLIDLKRSAGRAKDLLDVEALERIETLARAQHEQDDDG